MEWKPEPAALALALQPIAGTWGSGRGSKRETGGDLRVGGQRGGERKEGDQRCPGGARLRGDSTGAVCWPASRASVLVVRFQPLVAGFIARGKKLTGPGSCGYTVS